MNKGVIIGIIIVLLIAGGVGVFVLKNNQNKEEHTQVAEENSAVNEVKTENNNIGNGENSENDNNEEGGKEVEDSNNVEIKIKDYGVIKVELDDQSAPITVANFKKLIKEGFYDGLTFHRIIKDFMIQGGDPEGTGMGGSNETIKGEFSKNGVENNISHKRGVISMARSQDPDSASSQFFIMHQDGEYLDGNYAAFGHVTSGIEIVDKICEDIKPTDQNGTVPKENQPVIESIRMV